jgi:large subunit ribosomal protein L14
MVHESMLFKSADNSGAKIIKCVKILGSSYINKTLIGIFIKVVLKKLDLKKKLKKRKFYLGMPIVSKHYTKRLDGLKIACNKNKLLLFSDMFKFQGTRIYGYVLKELQHNLNLKLKSPKIIKYHNIQL